MFKKLISNLPFNPGLLDQVVFYSKRVKQEESLRRIGFAFMALAMFIQTFAVIAPPEKSLAYSSDYIINGLRTRDDILRAWDGKTSDRDVAAIYQKFGITRSDIEKLPMYPNVTVHSNYADYWTMGRTSLSAVSKSSQIKRQYKDSEVPVNYGNGTVYLRQLRAWDIVNSFNKYRAFEGWKDGKQFWILVDCGNLTMVGKPPILKKPAMQLRKTIVGGPRTLKPGDTFQFRLEYRNSVANSQPVENAVLTDTLETSKFDVASAGGMRISGNQLTHNIGNISYSSGYKTLPLITVRLKSNLKHGTKVCNTATLRASNAPAVSSGGSGLCITVDNPPPKPQTKPQPKPCPIDSSINENDSRCTSPALVCYVSTYDVNRTTKTFKMRTTVKSSNEYLTSISGYVYDYGDNTSKLTKASSSYKDEVTHQYQDGSYTATVVVNYKAGKGAAQTNESVACSAPIESEPDQPLSQEKTAKNLTQNLSEEQTLSKSAKAGDTIEYSLITHNSYNYDRTNINVSDYIGDLLDYANLDMAFLESQGGKFDGQTKTVSWEPQTVKSHSKLTNKFRIKLKDPVPATNKPSALTTAFDCQISNKFGTQIDIEVDCPLPKQAEYITERLPNTGPGTSLIIGFTATTIIAYFFARSRILAKELDLIRTDFAQTGGI